MMIIEIPNISDFEEINKIAKQVHELHVEWRPDIFLSVDIPIAQEELIQMIENKEIYVAKEKEKILGYAIIKIKEKTVIGYPYRKVISLEVIATDKQYQHSGIGKLLVNYILELGKKEQCTDFELTVNEENTNAIDFYKKLGMKVKNIKYQMKIE